MSRRDQGSPGGLPLVRLFVQYRDLLLSWTIFLGVLALMVALSEWKSNWVNVVLAEGTARTTGWVLDVLGEDAAVDGVFVSCSRCNFQIIGECTGFFPAAILMAAILASPAAWRPKLLGLGLGLPVIFLVNLVRLVTLCFLYRSYPQAFEMLHVLVWQSLVIFLTLLLWMVWFVTVGRPEAPPGEPASVATTGSHE